MKDIKYLLQETTTRVKKMHGIEPIPQNFRAMIRDRNAFNTYVTGLSEGMDQDETDTFKVLAGNTRVKLMENSMFQINPYETLTMPILRVFFPKLIAKELVNIMPIDKPDVIKTFVHASFKKYGDDGFNHQFPSVDEDVSRGPGVGVSPSFGTVSVAKEVTEGLTDILAEAGLDSTISHVEKDFVIVGIYDTTNNYVPVTIRPTVDGVFSQKVDTPGGTDLISGRVDFLEGTFEWSSSRGVVTKLAYQAYCSLEENQINPVTKFTNEKIRFVVVDRRISAEWTINAEQDFKALYDINLQSELVNVIGEQIAVDIDREIIGGLITANNALNPDTHTDTFDLNPPEGFPHGRKAWYENVIPPLNKLSAQIYNSSLMGPANTLACNPLDAAIFESLNTFEYTGTSTDGGDVGYKSATVMGGKWKILVSALIPHGKIIAKFRSNNLSKAAYVYAPYVPALLMPYPLGANPSLTVMTRYATKVIRHKAIGMMNIVDTE